MKLKPIIAIFVAVIFLLGFSSLSIAKGGGKKIKGEVTKIEGNSVTVKDDSGKETTTEVKDIKDIKVGDHVVVQSKMIKKMPEKHKKMEKSEKSEKMDKSEKSGKPGKAGY